MSHARKRQILSAALTLPVMFAAAACGEHDSSLTEATIKSMEAATGGAAQKLSYTPVTPCRIVDTRVAGGAFTTGNERSYVVRGDVSAQGGEGAGCVSPVGEPHAVQINVTIVPISSGNIKVGPAVPGTTQSGFINFKAGTQNVANAGMVKTCVGCANDLTCKANYGSAHVVVDVLGYFAPYTEALAETNKNLVYTPVAPCRLADTRQAGGELAPDETRELRVHGAVEAQGGNAGGCASPQGEPRAAHLKLTAVPAAGSASGNVAIFPKGATAPAGSLFYQESGQNIANALVVQTLHDSSAAEVELLNRNGHSHLVVDVLGYFYENDDATPPAGQDLRFVPVTPCRIADTRQAGGTLFPNEELTLRVYGAVGDQGGSASGCPAPLGEPRAVHVNPVAVPQSGAGNISVDAADAGTPSNGAINYSAAHQNIANALTVRTAHGSAGAPDIAIKNRHGQADLVVDVLGYFYSASDEPGPTLDGVVNLTASSNGTAVTPSLSVNGSHRWVAWVEHDHTAGSDATSSTLRATGFDNAAQVAGPLAVASGRIMSPQVLAEDNGDAWFFWTQIGASGGRLKARHRSGGSWDSGPVDVAPGKAGYPAAHLDANGDPWVVFEAYQGDHVEVHVARWTGTALSSPSRLSQNGVNAYQPAIELDAQDALWVAWSAYVNNNYDVFARRRVSGDFGATWQITDPVNQAGQNLGFHVLPTIHKGCCGVVWIGWVAKNPESRKPGYKPHLYGWVVDRRLQLRRVQPDGSRDPVKQVPVPFAAMKHASEMNIHSGPEGITIANARGKIGVFYRLVTNTGLDFPRRAFVQHMTVSNGLWSPAPLEVSGGGYTYGYGDPPVAAQTDQGLLVAWQQDNRLRSYPAGFAEPSSDVLLREILDSDLPATSVTSQAPQTYSKPLRFNAARPALSTNHQGQNYQLLIGDLHAHTEYSFCSTPADDLLQENYRSARDMAALDFYVVTDHGHQHSRYDWWVHRNACDLNQQASGMTILLGLEHTSSVHGHQNVIHDGCRGGNPTYRSHPTPAQLFSSLPYGQALAIPHHPSHEPEWSWWDMRNFDEDYNRLYEIYQVRGSFECYGCEGVFTSPYYFGYPGKSWKSLPANLGQGRGYFQDLLAMGHRSGVIASPDHGGTWGVAGVYAASRAPEDLFEALWERRTFGVSNAIARLALEFRADGHLMGEEYQLPSGSCPTLTGRVRTHYVDPDTGEHGEIDQIKIFRVDVGQPVPGEYGQIFQLTPGNGEDDVSFNYHDASCPGSGSSAYYLRAIQSDVSGIDVAGRPSIGWTSPVFVDW